MRSVFISGMHSGPNPSPGLGVARSLRAACRDVRLVGVDYSAASSGLHSSLVDEVVLFPPWSEIDIPTWSDQVRGLIEEEDAYWLPTLDLEVGLLAHHGLLLRSGVLAPDVRALAWTAKPPLLVADVMGVSVAPFTIDVGAASLERFLRGAPHGVWVKGRHHEAFRAWRLDDVQAAGAFIEAAWGHSWHVEAHVPGQECGIAFCARAGRLIDAVFMSKAVLTPDGKTWSGELAEVPTPLRSGLVALIDASDWTGGGEIELIRSWDGRLTTMELNPRFPAWVHGASRCGANLPAALVDNVIVRSPGRLGLGFTRVVEEVPVRDDIGMVPYRWPVAGAIDPATKHPSDVRALSRRVRDHLRAPSPTATTGQRCSINGPTDHPLLAEASANGYRFLDVLGEPGDAATPHRRVLPDLFAERVVALRRNLEAVGPVVLAHSVKTCPHPEILRRAARLGLVAEAISPDEVAVAAAHGLAAGDAVLNGPAKWWRAGSEASCWTFFADSLLELEALETSLDGGFALTAAVVGVRVRPRDVDSRFGIPLVTTHDLQATASLVRRLSERLNTGWGVHFHMAESVFGPDRWCHEATGALQRALQMAELLGRPPAVVDLGGGWHPEDIMAVPLLVKQALSEGVGYDVIDPQAPTVVLEPGKLLVEPAAVVVTRVLSADKASGDVVVDAALADIPEAHHRAHPVAHYQDGSWRPLQPGTGRLLGRSCMEADILARTIDCTGIGSGDHLVFGGCGAYDLSMAYSFGRGRFTDGWPG